MSNPDPRNMNRRPDSDGNQPQQRRPKSLLIWLVLAALFVFLMVRLYESTGSGAQEASIIDFYAHLEAGDIKKVILDEERLLVELRQPEGTEKTASTLLVNFPSISYSLVIEAIKEHNSTLERELWTDLDLDPPSQLIPILTLFAPWVVLGVIFWFFFLRPMRAPGSGVLSFGKSRAKEFTSKERTSVTFDDVAGIEEAKEEVKEIIEFLRNPERFLQLGGRVPRGVLLVGAPGTGKTLLARAIAGEANRPFFSISGSDFVEMFVGVGASRVRDLFRQAREKSPCIIFLDEVDAVGRRRGTGLGGGHDEREQTLNAILVEMDGFETDVNIILIAATNRPDVLDPALLRPGRFDRQIVVDLPDVKGREAILKVHARTRKLSDGVDLKKIARGTPGFAGADLENLINESAIIAVMKDKKAVDMDDLEEARDKVMWGRQKRSKVMAEEEKRAIAYHESGHAILAKLLPEVEPLHKVTIVPRGMALGATMSLPERDIYLMRRDRVLGDITVLMGGRGSEELFCDDISSGAQNDLERATEFARQMVCKWGMSDLVGPINYSENEEHLFLGREITRTKGMSEETSVQIDREIKRIVQDCHQRAKTLLKENAESVERLVEGLLQFEVLDAAQVDRVMAGETLEAAPNGSPIDSDEETQRDTAESQQDATSD